MSVRSDLTDLWLQEEGVRLIIGCKGLKVILFRHLVIVGSIAQQSSKGDGVGDAAQVDEEHSRDGLDMEAIVDITTIKRHLPFDVQP